MRVISRDSKQSNRCLASLANPLVPIPNRLTVYGVKTMDNRSMSSHLTIRETRVEIRPAPISYRENVPTAKRWVTQSPHAKFSPAIKGTDVPRRRRYGWTRRGSRVFLGVPKGSPIIGKRWWRWRP